MSKKKKLAGASRHSQADDIDAASSSDSSSDDFNAIEEMFRHYRFAEHSADSVHC